MGKIKQSTQYAYKDKKLKGKPGAGSIFIQLKSLKSLLGLKNGGDTMLKGNQAKLDKNKDGKISGEDFKMMKANSGKFMKTRSVTVPPSKGFKKEVIDERYNTYPKRIDKKGKSRIVMDSELKEMKEKIKKKKESGEKDIFDYIGDILKTPYKIRGGAKSGKMIEANMGMEAKSTQGYGAARTSGMGLQDENLIPGKSLDYYKDVM